MVEQIYYNRWHDELAPGHEDYWWTVGTIAEWIAYALEGSIHGSLPGPQRMSAIAVSQYKEKFGRIRVYCTLANKAIVETFYNNECAQIDANNKRYFAWRNGEIAPESREYPRPWTIKTYEERYPLVVPDWDEFYAEQVRKDIKWYRYVYLSAVRLWPQYKNVIVSAADFSEYLFQTREALDAYFDRCIDNAARISDDDMKTARLQEIAAKREFCADICELNDE